MTATANYTGSFYETHKVFDSNVDPKFNHVTPLKFEIGKHMVVSCWDYVS